MFLSCKGLCTEQQALAFKMDIFFLIHMLMKLRWTCLSAFIRGRLHALSQAARGSRLLVLATGGQRAASWRRSLRRWRPRCRAGSPAWGCRLGPIRGSRLSWGEALSASSPALALDRGPRRFSHCTFTLFIYKFVTKTCHRGGWGGVWGNSIPRQISLQCLLSAALTSSLMLVEMAEAKAGPGKWGRSRWILWRLLLSCCGVSGRAMRLPWQACAPPGSAAAPITCLPAQRTGAGPAWPRDAALGWAAQGSALGGRPPAPRTAPQDSSCPPARPRERQWPGPAPGRTQRRANCPKPNRAAPRQHCFAPHDSYDKHTPRSNLIHLHLFLSLCILSNHATFLQHLYATRHLTLQQFPVSPVSCWYRYASVSYSFLQIQPVPQPSLVYTTRPTKKGRCPTDSRNIIKANAHHGIQISFERRCYLVLNCRITLRHFQLDPQHPYLSRLRGSYRFASFNCIISSTEVTFIVKIPTIS